MKLVKLSNYKDQNLLDKDLNFLNVHFLCKRTRIKLKPSLLTDVVIFFMHNFHSRTHTQHELGVTG